MSNMDCLRVGMAAVQRMAMAGIVPVTWWSVAAEFQLKPRFADSPGGRTFFAGVAQGRLATVHR
ncbi:hypothetical protein ACIRG5_00420 [Lentzea sp. NPDC102401]|uniref:hypothetical protein n=1 Tax=Lentzea sp. NPDC102401 TaxID=3364128 RepID=UPI00380B4F22